MFDEIFHSSPLPPVNAGRFQFSMRTALLNIYSKAETATIKNAFGNRTIYFIDFYSSEIAQKIRRENVFHTIYVYTRAICHRQVRLKKNRKICISLREPYATRKTVG